MEEPIILDEKSREAVHAQRDAAQAVEVARIKQIQEVADKVTENIPDESQIATVVRRQILDVLAQGSEKESMMIMARVPYMCQLIMKMERVQAQMTERLVSIEDKIDARFEREREAANKTFAQKWSERVLLAILGVFGLAVAAAVVKSIGL